MLKGHMSEEAWINVKEYGDAERSDMKSLQKVQ